MEKVGPRAALEELAPAYEWETEVYVIGPLHEGRLEGDLVLVGGGVSTAA